MSARIEHFKRFNSLEIRGLPHEARLIVLLGPNGCGKSSLFDAFHKHLKVNRFIGLSDHQRRYYQRAGGNEAIDIDFHDAGTMDNDAFRKSIYVRSAYRHEPAFQRRAIEQQSDILDRHAIKRLIDIDQTVQNNYQRIAWRLLEKVTIPGLNTDDIMDDVIGDIQRSMETVFGDLQLDALVAPAERSTFTFTKGATKNFLYESLSAGEKAAFDLLLDIVVSRDAYDDSLYCIDEPEDHLSTRLQGRLLNELYGLMPDRSQLWIATHSIGMVRAAQQIRSESPDHVVFLDMGFDPDGALRNYDQAQILEPADPDHEFWRRHYGVALDDMADLLAPERIVMCEGSSESDDAALDESVYNRIFSREFPMTRFVSVGCATQVEKRMGDLVPLIERIIGGVEIIRLRDRDDLTQEEVERKRAEGVMVLSEYRNIESMLLSDDLLRRLCESVGSPDRFESIRNARDNALTHRTGQHASDDFKSAAQAVHQAAKTKLGLPRAGETATAFMRDVLAPLVADGTPEYAKLRKDVFGE